MMLKLSCCKTLLISHNYIMWHINLAQYHLNNLWQQSKECPWKSTGDMTRYTLKIFFSPATSDKLLDSQLILDIGQQVEMNTLFTSFFLLLLPDLTSHLRKWDKALATWHMNLVWIRTTSGVSGWQTLTLENLYLVTRPCSHITEA